MKKRSVDYFLLIITLIIVAYGLIMVFSASYYTGGVREGDVLFYFKRQLIGAIAGIICMIFLANFDYHKFEKAKYVLLIIAIAMLAAVFIPGLSKGEVNGSSRWLYIRGIGLTIQPSEVAKAALIIFIASVISRNQKYIGTFRYGILPVLIVTGVVCGFLILQPNFSAVVCICIMAFIMMIVGGAKWRHLGALIGIGGGAGFAMMISQSYRLKRVETLADPWKDPTGDGYQIIQSLYGIGGGGFFGRGLGNSRQKLLFLPYSESDFIFSIIVEELGFLGAFALIALFVLLAYRGIKTAIKAPDMFGTMIATGIVSIISIQVLINIGVATSTFPATGVSLPFVSYGSSSLLVFLAMMGILLNISRQSKG